MRSPPCRTSLGNDLGLSSATIKNWLSVLQASFVVFALPPFYENIGKRVIKSPQIYFSDTGLACHFLGIRKPEQASRDPLRGGFYENLIIGEIRKALFNRGRRPELYFYRDTNGNEVDLIVRQQRQLWPMEIKSAATFSKHFLQGIQRFRKLMPDRIQPGHVLYNGADQYQVDGTAIQNILLHGLPL